MVDIPLAPAGGKEPNDVAEALYKTARKQRRTLDAIAPVLQARARPRRRGRPAARRAQ